MIHVLLKLFIIINVGIFFCNLSLDKLWFMSNPFVYLLIIQNLYYILSHVYYFYILLSNKL
jgi:hypothetical protein